MAKEITTARVRTEIVEKLLDELEPKTYSSGKEGFFAQGKLAIEGRRFQAQVMLVEIQPK